MNFAVLCGVSRPPQIRMRGGAMLGEISGRAHSNLNTIIGEDESGV